MNTNFTMYEKTRQSSKGSMKFAVCILVSMAMLLGAASQATAGLPGVHTGTTLTGLFLGGNYIELGIRTNSDIGKFGADDKPANFLGRQGGLVGIGMVGDSDGFGVGNDLRIDYFLPGSPEESFSAGYKIAGTETTGKNFATTVTDTSSGNTLSATVVATLSGNLEVRQEISFNVNDKVFKNTVTLKNVGSVNLDNVRFMRSVDPDNTLDMGGFFTTIQTVERTMSSGDAQSKVTGVSLADAYSAAAGVQTKIAYYTADLLGKVSFNPTNGLIPGGVYDPNVYDSAQSKGSTATVDGYISIAFDVGTLTPGISKSFIYFTELKTNAVEYALTLNIAGAGTGNVTGSTADGTYESGTAITLAATPTGTSIFAGWSPAATCVNGFSLTTATTCTAKQGNRMKN